MNGRELEQEIERLWLESSQPATPSDAAERLAHSESRMTAIAQLHLLMQFATAAATAETVNEPAQRYDAVLSFLMTGQCAPDPKMRPLVDAIHQALTESLALPQ